MFRRKTSADTQEIAEAFEQLRGGLRSELQAEIQRVTTDLRAAVADAVSVAVREAMRAHSAVATPPPPNPDLLARLLESVEKLSSRFYDAWVDERKQAREQRVHARARRTEIQEAEKAAREAFEKAQTELSLVNVNCEECAAIRESRKPQHARDLMRHAIEKHGASIAN
jgi:small-conductance mechanosensitive channel